MVNERIASWYRRGLRELLVVVVALAFLGTAYYGVRLVALRIAAYMTVRVTRMADGPNGRAGSLVYQQTFGRTLASDAEHLLNDETTEGHWGSGLPSPEPTWWHYHLSFTWMGFVVETADVTTGAAPEKWTLSALGWSDSQIHVPNATSKAYTHVDSILEQLYTDSGGSFLLPLST